MYHAQPYRCNTQAKGASYSLGSVWKENLPHASKPETEAVEKRVKGTVPTVRFIG